MMYYHQKAGENAIKIEEPVLFNNSYDTQVR